MYAKLRGLKLPCEGDTLAEGIAVKQPGDTTFEIVRDLVDDIALVAERDLEKALSLLLTVETTGVEGAGAAGLAALLAHPARSRDRPVGAHLCAGNTATLLPATVRVPALGRSTAEAPPVGK